MKIKRKRHSVNNKLHFYKYKEYKNVNNEIPVHVKLSS